MRQILSVLALVAGSPLHAWEAMPAEDLAGRTVRYADAVQTFAPNGQTVYITDSPSRGNWRAQGGQYCSAWPPSDRWDCYGLEREGDRIRFIARDGSTTEGKIE